MKKKECSEETAALNRTYPLLMEGRLYTVGAYGEHLSVYNHAILTPLASPIDK